MKRYALYDTYDTYQTNTELGELLCTSDSYAVIKMAARERMEETDGECKLYVMTRYIYREQEQNHDRLQIPDLPQVR